ncbi:MAG: NUDIX hydrolase [SAR324 cluster bacterium]|nr:NUDIX hydrolase [SAR324 cluster bacterium]MBF0349952.1 NUDIX hydrolase [SAR324 cluster bacterium]
MSELLKKMPARIIDESSLHEGKWIDLVQTTYQDEAGVERHWECVHRKNMTEASVAVAKMVPSNRYILIRQFRPPAGHYTLEFPAGLRDTSETPEQTAIRELREETGYIGNALEVTPSLYLSPGIISERCHFVFLEVDETLPENQHPVPDTEPNEFIEVFVVNPNEISAFFNEELSRGSVIDAKLYLFFHAWLMNNFSFRKVL